MKISRKKIEVLQAQHGYNHGQLAQAAGISRQSLSTIMGRGTCRPDNAGKIARALGVDPEEIADDE